MASLQSNSTFSFKHHLTGKAWPACRAIFIQTPLDRHGQLAEQFYLLIQTPLDRGAGATPRSVPTQQTVYIVAPTLRAWPACRAILPFQTPLDRRGMASLAILALLGSLAIKHHLTGKAWPAWLFSLR